MDYIDTFISLANNMETKKDERQTLFGVKKYIDQIQLHKTQVIGPDRAFVREELMHNSEDAEVPPDWVSEWK